MGFVLLNFCLFLEVIKAVKLFYNMHYCCDKICNDHFEIAHICSFLNVSIPNFIKHLYVHFYCISLHT